MIDLYMPEVPTELKPKILVIGVGGAGGNAVNNMIRSKLEGVEFAVANTDAQALAHSLAGKKLQIGATLTRGLGAGSRPDVGRAAAEEQLAELNEILDGCNMVFITAGMGGGTGTGAAPIIAQTAREKGILTVGVVTKPFHFEGAHRMRTADSGIEDLQQFVDTLIIIPNQNLFLVANEKTTFADAFKMADDVLYSGVRGVTDLMIMPGLINLDFADIRSVMTEMGKAMMGTGESSSDSRALDAAEAAISNPLLDEVSMKGARGLLINITGGLDMTLFEVDEAAKRIRDEVDPNANIIFGSTFDESMDGKMRVSVVATGIEQPNQLRSRFEVMTNLAGGKAQAYPGRGLNTGGIPQQTAASISPVTQKPTPLQDATNKQNVANQKTDHQNQNELHSTAGLSYEMNAQSYEVDIRGKDSAGFLKKMTSFGKKIFQKEQYDNGDEMISYQSEEIRISEPQMNASELSFDDQENDAPRNAKQKQSTLKMANQISQSRESSEEDLTIPAFLRRQVN